MGLKRKKQARRRREAVTRAMARTVARSSAALLFVILRGLRVALVSLWLLTGVLSRATGQLFFWALDRPRRFADLGVGATVIVLPLVLMLWPRFPFDMEDSLDCLALNIYHEARGEPEEGRLAVAQVVMNRVSHQRFPDDVCAVVKQGGEWPRSRCQFSWWCDGRSDRVSDPSAMADIRDLAKAVLKGRETDPSNGALWYHADHVAPAWRKDFEKGPTIGRHIFYQPKPIVE